MLNLLSLIIFLTGVVIILSLKKIPVKHVGQVTILGKRIEGQFKTEGWCFLLLCGFLYDVILINIGKVSLKVIVEKALTPDGASSRVPVDIVFQPLNQKLIEYINSGGENGVKEQFESKVQERVREWCSDEEGGPSDWKELNKSHLEGTSVLITRIAKNSITEIPEYAQEVPTWIWLRYFSNPRPKKLLKNEEDWGKDDWKAVQLVIQKIINKIGNIDELKRLVTKRREEVNSLRTGDGSIAVEDLGITIKRLNIGDIDVLGEVAKHADQEAKEKEERKAEELELSHVLTQVKKFMDAGYSKSEAMETVQTERNKVQKNITEHKFNMAQETRESLEKMFGNLVEEVAKKFFKS